MNSTGESVNKSQAQDWAFKSCKMTRMSWFYLFTVLSDKMPTCLMDYNMYSSNNVRSSLHIYIPHSEQWSVLVN